MLHELKIETENSENGKITKCSVFAPCGDGIPAGPPLINSVHVINNLAVATHA